MLNKKIIDEYKKLEPSDSCRDKIMEQARALDAKRNARRNGALRFNPARLRPVLAAAVCCLAIIVGCTALLPALLDTGDTITLSSGKRVRSAEYEIIPESVEYSVGISLATYGRQIPSEQELLTAPYCFAFEFDIKESVVISAEHGTLLVWDDESKCYVDYGCKAAFAGKQRICWYLPEAEQSGEWSMLLSYADSTRTLTVTNNGDGPRVYCK